MSWPSIGSAVLALVGAAACGDGDPQAESRDIPGLVVAVHPAARPLDPVRALGDVDELVRAASVPHATIGDVLGPHRLVVVTATEVREAGVVVEGLRERAVIDLANQGTFHASLENSRDYGRDVYFVGGELYLRPRYGEFNRRPPTDDGEPARIRGEIGGALGADLALCAPGLALSRGADRQVAGRTAHVVVLGPGRGPAPRNLPAQEAWRKAAVVSNVHGEIALDAESGVPLQGKLSAEIGFQRDGHRYVMALSVDHAVSGIGVAAGVAAPAADRIAPVAAAPRELEERDELLEGIAPPAARARTPDNPTGASSAAAPAGAAR